MFKAKFHNFHGFDNIVLADDSGNSIEVIPDKGGLLKSLKFKNFEKLDAIKTKDELINNPWGKSILMYPFPNRLKNGQFKFNGKTYQFPINDTGTGNALHGFGADQKMSIGKITLEEDQASIQLNYSYKAELSYYPWAFYLSVIYTIKSEGALELTMEVENGGANEMPFGMGWHPYFNIQEKGNCCQLTLPKVNQVEIDETMIPTGHQKQMVEFSDPKYIGNYNFDTSFELDNNQLVSKVKLMNCDHDPLIYWQQSGKEEFRYLQVFIPPERDSIALEPMTCNIDAYNNKQGLWVLQPGEQRAVTCGVHLTKDQ